LRGGRKSMDRRCGKVIEAKPTLGQISPSGAAWAPRGQTGRRLDDHGRLRQEGNSVRSAIKCAFASTAAKRRAENDRLLPHLRSETESASRKKFRVRAAAAFGQRFRAPEAELRVAGHGSKPRGPRLHLVAPQQRPSPTDNGSPVKWRCADRNSCPRSAPHMSTGAEC
jgi:hypothetical protein